MEQTNVTVTATACSKVLVTGAYLIIDPKYEGLVLATDAKFHCKATLSITHDPIFQIRVVSRQFNLDVIYKSDSNHLNSFSGDGNRFIDKCITFLDYMLQSKQGQSYPLNQELIIELNGDNAFYSQRENVENFNYDTLSQQPQFTIPKDPTKKTGLGSSASLIVSFVASTFKILGIASTKQDIHIYAQILNALIQDKVGSGFDIACSVFGSQIYRRFSNVKELIELVQLLSSKAETAKITECLQQFIATFDFKLKPIVIRDCYELCLIDVNSGSDTVIMVKKVLEWAKEMQKDPSDLFSNELCYKLSQTYIFYTPIAFCVQQYNELQRILQENESQGQFGSLRSTCSEVRKLIQQLSNETKVPIEPQSSTTILDEILKLQYIAYAAVPGAGGNDALFAIGEKGLHEQLQRDICSKHLNSEGQRISVLPVKLLTGDSLLIE